MNFKDITHQLNNYNEIYSLNKHVSKENHKARGTLARTNDILKTNVMKEKEAFFLSEYKANSYTRKRDVLFLTTFVFAAFFIIGGLFSQQKITRNMMYIVIAGGSFLWLLGIAMIIKRMPSRRLNNWNMFYWGDKAPGKK